MADVEKSLEIFLAMDSIVVARRCAEFTKEMIALAKRYLQDSQRRQTTSTGGLMTDQATLPDVSLLASDDQNMSTDSDSWNENFFAAFLNQEMPGQERASALANLYDPNILEGFALSDSASTQGAGFVDMPMYFSSQPGDEGGQTRPLWGMFESREDANGMTGVDQGPGNPSFLGGDFNWS